jgi:hypothetical protein
MMKRIFEGQRPDRPDTTTDARCLARPSDEMWSLITECWSQQRSSRPVVGHILNVLATIPQDAELGEQSTAVQYRYTMLCFATDAQLRTAHHSAIFDELGDRLYGLSRHSRLDKSSACAKEISQAADWVYFRSNWHVYGS